MNLATWLILDQRVNDHHEVIHDLHEVMEEFKIENDSEESTFVPFLREDSSSIGGVFQCET